MLGRINYSVIMEPSWQPVHHAALRHDAGLAAALTTSPGIAKLVTKVRAVPCRPCSCRSQLPGAGGGRCYRRQQDTGELPLHLYLRSARDVVDFPVFIKLLSAYPEATKVFNKVRVSVECNGSSPWM